MTDGPLIGGMKQLSTLEPLLALALLLQKMIPAVPPERQLSAARATDTFFRAAV